MRRQGLAWLGGGWPLARWHGRRLARLTGGLVLLVLLASGCAAIPSSGTVQPAPAPPALGGGGGPDCCGVIFRGPQKDWGPEDVVSGFLQASASFANDHAVAREYLTASANRTWRPGSAVTILAGSPSLTKVPPTLSGGRVTNPTAGGVTVEVQGRQLATLKGSGEYIPSAPGDIPAQEFTLTQVHGQFRIDHLPSGTAKHPSHQLLLDSTLFHLVYTARNLYYYGLRESSLVPNPVFVPTSDTNPATQLIHDLFEAPDGELHNVVGTAFPPGSKLAKLQVLPGPSGGKIAIVDLTLPVHGNHPQQDAQAMQHMATQVVATLTGSAYNPALFSAVKLRINGRFWTPHPGQLLLDYKTISGYIPHWNENAPLYYLTSSGSSRVLGSRNGRGSVLPGVRTTFGTIAVAPSGKYFAGIAGSGTTVYTASLGAGSHSKEGGHVAAHLHAALEGTSLTGISWDNRNDLWVVGKRRHTWGVWVLPSGRGPALPVSVLPAVGPVTGVRLAPDGVRVAMIVGTGKSARLALGAVNAPGKQLFILGTLQLGQGLTGVTSVTWYDEDHLLAVTKQGSVSILWDVPANGDVAQTMHESGVETITAAGPHNPLYLSFSTGQVERKFGLNEPKGYVTAGKAATYPG
jgi:hypothetical protein